MTREEQCARKTACVEMARLGMSFKEIAEKTGLKEGSVRQTCADYGIRQYKNNRKPPKKVNRETVIDLLKKGYAQKEIAASLGVSITTINKIAKEENLSYERIKIKRQNYREYKALGYSLREVAEHFGVGISEVQLACSGMPRKHSEGKNGCAPWNKGLHTGNQYTNGTVDVIAKVKEQIKKANPEMEYVSGYTGCSSPVMLRHNVCGQTFERSMNPIRHGMKTICPYCKKTEQRRKEQQHKADVQRRKKERQELTIVNKDKAIEKAAERREERRHNCPVCGTSTTRRKYCSDTCARTASTRKTTTQHEAKRRARISAQMVDRDITLQQLYTKDNGVCWICGLLCDWSDIEDRGYVKVAGNMYPSIDHVVPLSHGGEHSWANVRLAHRICNSVRYEHAPRGHKKVG